ncbi:MAG: aminotransferase class V-fold PLP-dependent enzyme [Deltaproteobacteria bacterium]|nr:aminotransferase class V-fold PLP-dependent enzyme [Deltaproteobacteria bacterium]
MDLRKIRNETKGCKRVIHFNNAGASLPPDPVYKALTDHLELERTIGGYEAATASREKIDRFYTAFAELLHCQPTEIAYVENATRAWDMAFYAIPFQSGDRILTTQVEYGSNYLAFLQVAQRFHVKIDVVPNDETGQISIASLENMVGEDVRLIAATHVPTQGGLVNPAQAIGRVARRHGILYLLDACQSVGQLPVDVRTIGCDMLSGTGRKYLRGPRGTGFLYVRKSLLKRLTPPFIDLRAATWIDRDRFELRPDARRFENWESYVAGRIGLAAAVDYALDLGISAISERIYYLADLLRDRLAHLPGITIQDMGRNRCGIVTFTKADETPTEIKKRLTEKHINISVSPARYARLDFDSRGLEELARASVHYFNTEAEIDTFCEAIASA